MKLSLLTLVLLGLLSASCTHPTPSRQTASSEVEGNQELYEALGVREIDARQLDERGNPSLGAMIFSKSVGGLTCTRQNAVVLNPKINYSCAGKELNAAEIYNSLNVAEERIERVDQNNNPLLGSSLFVKKAGGLSCYKTLAVVPRAIPKFTCKVDL